MDTNGASKESHSQSFVSLVEIRILVSYKIK